jgi:hypothetical protein
VLLPAITADQILDNVAACGAASVLVADYATARRLRAGTLAAAAVLGTAVAEPHCLGHAPVVAGSAAVLARGNLARLPGVDVVTALLVPADPMSTIMSRPGWICLS